MPQAHPLAVLAGCYALRIARRRLLNHPRAMPSARLLDSERVEFYCCNAKAPTGIPYRGLDL